MHRRRTLAAASIFAALAASVSNAAASPSPSPSISATPPGTVPAASGGADWPAYERNTQHSSAAFGDPAITRANAGQLTVRWRFTTSARFDASATVVGGRVYIGDRKSRFFVLDAATGNVIWQRQLDTGLSTFCNVDGIVGTAAVLPDPVTGALTVYVPGAHQMYALDPADGSIRWQTPIGPATPSGRGLYFNWASPTIAGGRIFMGLAAKCETHLIRGGVVSLDQHTGALLHTYYAVPAGKVGASVWSSEASDGTSVWATTGNPDPNGSTIDDSYSVVRLSASTLARQDTWTVPSAQAADLDFGSSPNLFHGVSGGTSTNLVGACNKNGFYYAWRQDNLSAGPIWATRVAGSEVSGAGFCITSAAWDYQALKLFVAAKTNVLGGRAVGGAVREIDPSTGRVLWQQPLPCGVSGSPTLNAVTHVLAVVQYKCPAGATPSVRLFDETNGRPVGTIANGADVFAQPVFAAGQLFIADDHGNLTAYGP